MKRKNAGIYAAISPIVLCYFTKLPPHSPIMLGYAELCAVLADWLICWQFGWFSDSRSLGGLLVSPTLPGHLMSFRSSSDYAAIEVCGCYSPDPLPLPSVQCFSLANPCPVPSHFVRHSMLCSASLGRNKISDVFSIIFVLMMIYYNRYFILLSRYIFRHIHCCHCHCHESNMISWRKHFFSFISRAIFFLFGLLYVFFGKMVAWNSILLFNSSADNIISYFMIVFSAHHPPTLPSSAQLLRRMSEATGIECTFSFGREIPYPFMIVCHTSYTYIWVVLLVVSCLVWEGKGTHADEE